jgi:lipopolysaccharide transport system permease protein
MQVRIESPVVHLEEPRTLRVRCAIHTDSPDGLALGSQIIDPQTGIFIAEGRWTAVGESAHRGLELDIELPPEPGRYRVFVSPVSERDGWQYQHGGRFLLIDAEVEQRRAHLLRAVVTTLARLKRATLAQSFTKALAQPALAVWRNRSLIESLVRRDILARYRGSFGDVLWTLLNPLLLMATYFFVFGVVLQARFGADPSRSGFVLYFLAGMLPWLAFSEAAGRAPHVILEHRNFVKKLVFPVETLPVSQVAAALVTEAFALAVFMLVLIVTRGGVPLTASWLPLLLVPQVLFTLGICWFLAALGVFVRDLSQVIGFLLTLWFFLTPICYPETSLPPSALDILSLNPIYVLVRGYRDVFLESRHPDWASVAKLWAVAGLVLVFGHAWFYKLRRSFADVI